MDIAPQPIRQPAITSVLPPSLRARRPAKTPTANMVIADGSSMRPDWVMLAPKP